jgi:hypothetical protein
MTFTGWYRPLGIVISFILMIIGPYTAAATEYRDLSRFSPRPEGCLIQGNSINCSFALKLVFADGTPAVGVRVVTPNQPDIYGINNRTDRRVVRENGWFEFPLNTSNFSIWGGPQGDETMIEFEFVYQNEVIYQTKISAGVLKQLLFIRSSTDIGVITLPFLPSTSHLSAISSMNSNTCLPSQTGSRLFQGPDCNKFEELSTFIEPFRSTSQRLLPYREETEGQAIFAVGGFQRGGMMTSISITPTVCSNARYLSLYDPVNPMLAYFKFDTKGRGMCRITVNNIVGGNAETLNVQLPVENVEQIHSYIYPYAQLSGLPKTVLKVKVGEERTAPQPYFWLEDSRLRKRFDKSINVWELAPMQYRIETPNVCFFTTESKIKSRAEGLCTISIIWDSFHIDSEGFAGQVVRFDFFKSEKPLTKAEKAKAQNNPDEGKLCSSSSQNALKKIYKSLTDSEKRLTEINKKLQNVNLLINQIGKEAEIKLPANEYPDLLKAFPVLASNRQVPLYIYAAVLQGSLIGEGKVHQTASILANQAYSKASAGCKKVVGKP